jgi:lipoprotein LpqH
VLKALPPHARVEVAGHIQYNGDEVQCVSANGQFSIGIGADPNVTGIGAVLSDAAGSSVTSVGVGDIGGDIYGFASEVPGVHAVASHYDGNAYTISGTVINLANPYQGSIKQFQMNVTCPA